MMVISAFVLIRQSGLNLSSNAKSVSTTASGSVAYLVNPQHSVSQRCQSWYNLSPTPYHPLDQISRRQIHGQPAGNGAEFPIVSFNVPPSF